MLSFKHIYQYIHMDRKRIAIINGGGDCAGLNAVISSAVISADRLGYESIGIIRGMDGLLDKPNYVSLTPAGVAKIAGDGGTIIKTTNKGRFAAKVGDGYASQIDPAVLNEAKANIEALGIHALIVIGGDGTLTGAKQLSDLGVKMVGVPKTIDNDLSATDVTFGFSSAVDFVSDALDRVHTTAESHNRVIFVETMGRNAGWIALYGGVAGIADIILIPEFEFSYEKVITALRERRLKGRTYSIVVVAEGAHAAAESAVAKTEAGKENLLGGISYKIMAEIAARTGEEFEMRNLILGHLQRGGAPNAEDRVLAQRYGVAAVQALHEGKFGQMVSLQNGRIITVNIDEAISKIKLVDQDTPLYQAAQSLGISFCN